MSEQRKKLGIIGGMGPEATVYLMQKIIELTPATRDQDHVDMLVSNHASIPDRTAFIRGESEESPLPAIVADARALVEAGCQVLAIPCNTSHVFYPRIVDALQDAGAARGTQTQDMPRGEGAQSQDPPLLLNIVDEALAACQAQGARKVGVLATWGTLLTDIYGTYASSRDMRCIYPQPDMQDSVNSLIYDYVKAGKPVPPEMLTGFYDAMRELGCDAVVLGCTELSVAHAALSAEVQAAYPFVVDSLEALAAACVRECA